MWDFNVSNLCPWLFYDDDDDLAWVGKDNRNQLFLLYWVNNIFSVYCVHTSTLLESSEKEFTCYNNSSSSHVVSKWEWESSLAGMRQYYHLLHRHRSYCDENPISSVNPNERSLCNFTAITEKDNTGITLFLLIHHSSFTASHHDGWRWRRRRQRHWW